MPLYLKENIWFQVTMVRVNSLNKGFKVTKLADFPACILEFKFFRDSFFFVV